MIRKYLCAWMVMGVAASAAPAADAWQVWVDTTTTHLLRDGPPGQTAKARISCARNEWRGFQILMRANMPVKGIRLEPADLTGPAHAVLRTADARFYRQHQIHLTAGTHRNDAFKPGWYPDPLIPFTVPATNRPAVTPRFVAVPFDLPADETHGFWIDLYVPTNVPPGEYRGTYRLTADDGKTVEVPVVATVWDFQLPITPTLKTAFGSPVERMRTYYAQRAKDGKETAPTDWATIETQCNELLAEHRINASPPVEGMLIPKLQEDGTYRFPPERIRALGQFIDRYHLNAVILPGGSYYVHDPDKERARLHAVLKAFDAAVVELNRPDVVFCTYRIDEPNDKAAYDSVRRWGKAVRESKTVVKVMVTEQTQTQDPAWGDLYGAVDIWCPLFSLFDSNNAAKRQASGETIWAYTALCQNQRTPWWHIEWPLLSYRVPAWIAWRYRIRGLLYWGGMSYWKQADDPWTDGATYGGKPGSGAPIYNGEGTMVYPARAVGYDGIVPSLRLKALRDSIEDHEYMSILERSGLAVEAEKVVLPLAASWFKWEEDPLAYDKARSQLAEMIIRSQRY